MKPNEEVKRLLLLQARDGTRPSALNHYSDADQVYNGSLLIDDGYVVGRKAYDEQGGVIGAAVVALTPSGHKLLDSYERAVGSSQAQPNSSSSSSTSSTQDT